jgi:hypothetical protein
MSEILNILDIRANVLQNGDLLNLHEGVDAGWEEHVSSVRLTIRTCLL